MRMNLPYSMDVCVNTVAIQLWYFGSVRQTVRSHFTFLIGWTFFIFLKKDF